MRSGAISPPASSSAPPPVLNRRASAIGGTIRAMVPVCGQWRCRICNFDRCHQVSVLRKNSLRYETSFDPCSLCSVMFFNPSQWTANSSAAPNIEAPPNIVTPMRRQRR